MRNRRFDIVPTSGGVGAMVGGADLAQPLEAADFAELRAALAEHGVLFFRDQHLSPAQHLEFARGFGTININRFFRAVDGHPEIAEVLKEPDQRVNIGGGWHTDHSYDKVPALGSILLARELPPRGGDTLFADLHRAYAALSEGLKQTLRGLRAVHSSRHIFGRGAFYDDQTGGRIGNQDAALQDSEHPVVLRHPDSGKPVLYVNPGFTIRFAGWTAEESAPLLQYLYAHATKPEFTYRFRWGEGSIAFWDNRATWHYAANDYHGHRRLMHRITIEGSALEQPPAGASA